MEFDNQGNLYPYELIPIDLQLLNFHFSLNSDRRALLIREFERYCMELSTVLHQDYRQLIGGSFVSIKYAPNDVDVANLIQLDDPDDEQIESIIPFLTLGGSLDTYMVDGHLIPVYHKSDERYTNTVARIDYFRKWFGVDRNNQPRGILHLSHIV